MILSAVEFERVFKDLYRPLCLYALRFVSSTDDAEDIVQQAFADVWEKNIHKEAITDVKAYMFRAVHNRSISSAAQVSTIGQLYELPADLEDSTEEERIYQSERDARLWNAIDALPPERKKVFLLSKCDGLKYQEIADQLNISVKTVENQIGKALKFLRESARRIYSIVFC
ncbi:MAG: RNA polymerase sigma-70 factor [Parabacteroides sp.]